MSISPSSACLQRAFIFKGISFQVFVGTRWDFEHAGTPLTHRVHGLHVVHEVPLPQVDGELGEHVAKGNRLVTAIQLPRIAKPPVALQSSLTPQALTVWDQAPHLRGRVGVFKTVPLRSEPSGGTRTGREKSGGFKGKENPDHVPPPTPGAAL